jgi:hypothetical protein
VMIASSKLVSTTEARREDACRHGTHMIDNEACSTVPFAYDTSSLVPLHIVSAVYYIYCKEDKVLEASYKEKEVFWRLRSTKETVRRSLKMRTVGLIDTSILSESFCSSKVVDCC